MPGERQHLVKLKFGSCSPELGDAANTTAGAAWYLFQPTNIFHSTDPPGSSSPIPQGPQLSFPLAPFLLSVPSTQETSTDGSGCGHVDAPGPTTGMRCGDGGRGAASSCTSSSVGLPQLTLFFWDKRQFLINRRIPARRTLFVFFFFFCEPKAKAHDKKTARIIKNGCFLCFLNKQTTSLLLPAKIFHFLGISAPQPPSGSPVPARGSPSKRSHPGEKEEKCSSAAWSGARRWKKEDLGVYWGQNAASQLEQPTICPPIHSSVPVFQPPRHADGRNLDSQKMI